MNYENKIKELREELSITQSDVAKILKIERGTYSHYETENIIMPIKHLVILCEFFNVSLDYIFKFSNIRQYDNSIKYIDNKLAGSRLKEFRKDNKLTQDQLANFLNTNRSVIANYERGRNLVSTPFLYETCKKYNISADYLLGKVDEPKYLK